MIAPDTPARDVPFTALDFETTGVVKGFESLPWQLGAVSLQGGRVETALDTYLRVPADYPFSRHAPGEHRAHRDAIAAAPAALDVWARLHPLLAATVPVAHNIAAERTILTRLAPLTRYPLWVDTLRLSRQAYPSLPSHALERLIPALGLRPALDALIPGRAPHDALYDAAACALLLRYLLSLPGWDALTVADLASP
ncbi:MAG TPA: hypothetical protein IAC79_07350 [Candidatus Spyradenecus faecavium]|uniref:Exonuclease domain-containing protein n=1 Tax=Candidatus Spyradenecus faecavium TaxID=2840947 RepID=A0A9D1T2Y3_9BACT|nr:hypothetical protein [Candidatus Spyradenecus faecavium]